MEEEIVGFEKSIIDDLNEGEDRVELEMKPAEVAVKEGTARMKKRAKKYKIEGGAVSERYKKLRKKEEQKAEEGGEEDAIYESMRLAL